MQYIWSYLFIFTLMMSHPLPANAQVQSTSFNLMLKLLLSSKTPVVQVPQAAEAVAKETLFLDAREANEFKVSHIAGARWVGAHSFSLQVVADLPKDQPIIVYCSVGKRSEAITLQMQKAGFTRVFNLYGGIFEWVNQGHPVVNQKEEPTARVHAYSRFWGKWLNKGQKVYD